MDTFKVKLKKSSALRAFVVIFFFIPHKRNSKVFTVYFNFHFIKQMAAHCWHAHLEDSTKSFAAYSQRTSTMSEPVWELFFWNRKAGNYSNSIIFSDD